VFTCEKPLSNGLGAGPAFVFEAWIPSPEGMSKTRVGGHPKGGRECFYMLFPAWRDVAWRGGRFYRSSSGPHEGGLNKGLGGL